MADVPGYIRATTRDKVGESELYGFEVDGELRIVTCLDGEIYAFDGICTHEYAELTEGEIEDGAVWCPLHGSGFDVRTGAVTNLPAVLPLATYDVSIVEGEIYVSLEPRDRQ